MILKQATDNYYILLKNIFNYFHYDPV